MCWSDHKANATGLDVHLNMQAAGKAAAKGKAVDPNVLKGGPASQQSLPAFPAKPTQGQCRSKPTAARPVSGAGTSKQATAKAVAEKFKSLLSAEKVGCAAAEAGAETRTLASVTGGDGPAAATGAAVAADGSADHTKAAAAPEQLPTTEAMNTVAGAKTAVDASAVAIEADASPTAIKAPKKKRKQKGYVTALQAEPTDLSASSAVPVTQPKKKRKTSKAVVSNGVPSLNAAPTPETGDLIEPQDDKLKQVTKATAMHDTHHRFLLLKGVCRS